MRRRRWWGEPARAAPAERDSETASDSAHRRALLSQVRTGSSLPCYSAHPMRCWRRRRWMGRCPTAARSAWQPWPLDRMWECSAWPPRQAAPGKVTNASASSAVPVDRPPRASSAVHTARARCQGPRGVPLPRATGSGRGARGWLGCYSSDRKQLCCARLASHFHAYASVAERCSRSGRARNTWAAPRRGPFLGVPPAADRGTGSPRQAWGWSDYLNPVGAWSVKLSPVFDALP